MVEPDSRFRRDRGDWIPKHTCTAGSQIMSLSPVLRGQKSAVSSCPSSSPRRVLPGALLWDCDSLPLTLLLDASRDHCFIDENLAKQAQLPVEVLPESRIIQDLDSRHIARINSPDKTPHLSLLRQPPRGDSAVPHPLVSCTGCPWFAGLCVTTRSWTGQPVP